MRIQNPNFTTASELFEDDDAAVKNGEKLLGLRSRFCCWLEIPFLLSLFPCERRFILLYQFDRYLSGALLLTFGSDKWMTFLDTCALPSLKKEKVWLHHRMHFPKKHDANILNTVGELLMIAEWIQKEYVSNSMNRIKTM